MKESACLPLLAKLFNRSGKLEAPLADELRREVFEREADLIEEIFRRGSREGRFHVRQPKILAQTLVAALRGIESASELQVMQATIEEYLEEFIRALLNGVKVNKAAVEN